MKGKSIVVTGGGGSIGAEICDRIVDLRRGAAAGDREFRARALRGARNAGGQGSRARAIEGRIADVRDRERIFRLFAEFKPDIVFHAAALKHVPLLEQDWGEGVKTNVFGSVNVADAAVAAGAAAMVMISTDKAIEPVSVLGATKRFAEMYCQALDAEHSARRDAQAADAADLGAVRQRARLERLGGAEVQGADRGRRPGDRDASRHGALLHDHPRSVRPGRHRGEPRARPERSADVSVYVLNMGQPVKILDLAERMIRLVGPRAAARHRHRLHAASGRASGCNEILFAREEPSAEIGIAGIVAARPSHPSLEAMRAWLATLGAGPGARGARGDLRVLRDAVPDFRGEVA